MKKSSLLALLPAALIAISSVSCEKENTWDTYKEWRETNDAYYAEAKALRADDGSGLFYSTLNPAWYPGSGVLIHYFNDTTKTGGNLKPLATSSCAVKYKGWLCNDEPFDSSYTSTSVYGDSIAVFTPLGVIDGWTIALTAMHVGDSVRVVVPWQQGYGTQSTGSILPFSTLTFDIKLVDIIGYETDPAD